MVYLAEDGRVLVSQQKKYVAFFGASDFRDSTTVRVHVVSTTVVL